MSINQVILCIIVLIACGSIGFFGFHGVVFGVGGLILGLVACIFLKVFGVI